MLNLPSTIETDRLTLRRLTIDDASDVFSYASDPQVTRYMDWPTHTSMQVSQDWIGHTITQWEKQLEFTWGVVTKQGNDRIVGAVGCTEITHKVSIGYVFNKDHWGKGIATEAATALVSTLSNVEGVTRIWATCDCKNLGSANVLTKSGCVREGILRNWSVRPNLPGAPSRDDYVFAKAIDA